MTFTPKMLTDLAYFFTNTDRSTLEQVGIIAAGKPGDDKWKRYNRNFDIFILKSDADQLTALASLVNEYIGPSPEPSLDASEVTHEDICNTNEGGPCNCDWSAALSNLATDATPETKATRSSISGGVPEGYRRTEARDGFAEYGLVPISKYGAPSLEPAALGLREAADAYVSEAGIEHSGGIIEAAFDAGVRWSGQLGAKPKGACPNCGRQKAQSADDAASGMCPKWWAIRDADAERDCERAKS